VNDVKKLRMGFDWKQELVMESTRSFTYDERKPKPSESDLNQRGTLIVHDIKEDTQLMELMSKV
jgi:hypothetical protein